MKKLHWETLSIDESNWKDCDEYTTDLIVRIFNEMNVQEAIKITFNKDNDLLKNGFNFYAEFLVLTKNNTKEINKTLKRQYELI